MLSCKHASRLLSASLDRDLSLIERIMLTSHLALCSVCRRFRVQVNFLQSLGREQADGRSNGAMPPEAKDRIQKSVDDELNL